MYKHSTYKRTSSDAEVHVPQEVTQHGTGSETTLQQSGAWAFDVWRAMAG